MQSKTKVVITGATGRVGTFAALFLSRLGIADELYIAARTPSKLSDVFYNSQTNSIMRDYKTVFHPLELNIENQEDVASAFGKIQPDMILNCAAGLSLYPFFPALRSRQKKMGFIPGFVHTLPKDMFLLLPLMKGVRKSCENTTVVNLVAPDIASYILKPLGLSPNIGAGTLDSTSQGVRMKIAEERAIIPTRVDVRMVAHHALRRYPASQVQFAIQIFVDQCDVTEEYSHEDICKLIDFATDTTGVETENSPVQSNAAVTAASGVETTYSILSDSGKIRHASGFSGTPGAMPVRLNSNCIEPVLPKNLTMEDAVNINHAGMKMDGLDHVDEDGTVYFTEKEAAWIKDGLGLKWGSKLYLENLNVRCQELAAAYKRMQEEER